MRKKIIFVLSITIMCIACQKPKDIPGQTEIEWDAELGNFTFTNFWDYPEGVHKNSYGQLSCDGFCPPETDAMKDSAGRILDDSLTAFYKLVDTTRVYHTLQSDAQCPEWSGANYMIATRVQDTIFCNSLGNVGTHSSLHLKIVGNICKASIVVNSITGKKVSYPMEAEYGYMKIDPELLKNGTLKAAFNMGFGNDSHSRYMYWKGLIYTKVTEEKATQ